MNNHETQEHEPALSKWWLRSLAIVILIGFVILIIITKLAYNQAPPIPEKVTDEQGQVISSRDDIENGQTIFLRYGLMGNGTVWGHGGYLGPDFSATALHRTAQMMAQALAQQQFGKQFSELDKLQQSAIDGQVAHQLKTNRYNPQSGTLVLWY